MYLFKNFYLCVMTYSIKKKIPFNITRIFYFNIITFFCKYLYNFCISSHKLIIFKANYNYRFHMSDLIDYIKYC